MNTDTPPQPTDDLIAAIEAVQPPPARVFAVEWNDRRVWVKLAVPNKRKSWHVAQSVVAALTRLAIARPTVCAGGAKGLRDEAAHLIGLRARGVRVPEVIAVTKKWMAIGDLGTPLQNRLDEETDVTQRAQLMARAAQALSAFHQKGEWHGSGMMRDMTVADQQIGFIDFEENLNNVMPLAAAQARDVLLFLLSATRYSDVANNPLPELLAVYAATAPKAVIVELARLIPLAHMVHALLRPFAKRLGRDARQGLIVALTLKSEIPRLLASDGHAVDA